MNHKTQQAPHLSRWTTVIPPILLAVGATAQTVSSAEALRAVLKVELTQLSLSIKEQAKAVATEMAEDSIEELAAMMTVSAPKPQLVARNGGSSDDDNS